MARKYIISEHIKKKICYEEAFSKRKDFIIL